MNNNLIVIAGPTGVGKTDLSICVADKINGEIISADSRQIYRYMDIGTAKVEKEYRDKIKHHMIDIVDPNEEFSVSDFKKITMEIIDDINKKGKIPLLVGGTGLYINSIVYDIDFTNVASNKEIREYYESISLKKGKQYLYELLLERDYETARKLNINDTKRIIRALEVYDVTKTPMSKQNKDFRKPSTKYNLSMYLLYMDRNKLYDRINARVDKMIEDGLINEVETLLKLGYEKSLNSMQGIGYKEIVDYLENKISLDEAVELIKKRSRNYAKRQLTWFKRDERYRWINLDEFSDVEDLCVWICSDIKKKLTKGGNYFESTN
ncbi:tRNA (adenosine(37)-N6)-dimethylallyltransferase MiaA [Soehngenia longivitae]|uniref:tRNA dimethylallyltransferase n=1 Tax=Soehngenia longivitae TaxID=2562294 RepID=A0A4Z0D211_9FIRM|nr:tRNA (adenosine(37)-N6)-dimethylallyltransferase MiaA [Soehngenia longivitae]TFZ39791.1 tRNA (adenosine(37)-N6)-dimethylallyltransferase MiaA [Soehngenia longivitae]